MIANRFDIMGRAMTNATLLTPCRILFPADAFIHIQCL